MTTPQIRIHDLATNEVIDRDMTSKEFAEYEKFLQAKVEEKTKMESKAIAKAALLDKLGLTAEEAVLLLS